MIQLIIKEQEQIIGPIAWEEARKVEGLVVVSDKSGEVKLEGEGRVVIDMLVARYERIYGPISREVCKDAVARILPTLASDQVPQSLRS